MTASEKKAWKKFGKAVLAADPERAAIYADDSWSAFDRKRGPHLAGVEPDVAVEIADAVDQFRRGCEASVDEDPPLLWAVLEAARVLDDGGVKNPLDMFRTDSGRGLYKFTRIIAAALRHVDSLEPEPQPEPEAKLFLRADFLRFAKEKWGPEQNGRKRDCPNKRGWAGLLELEVERSISYWTQRTKPRAVPEKHLKKIAEILRVRTEELLRN